MLDELAKGLVRFRGSVIQPARQRCAWIDQLCEKAAVLGQLLFGEAGTTLAALSQTIALQQQYLRQQMEMRRAVSSADSSVFDVGAAPDLLSSRLCDAGEFQVPEIRRQLVAVGYDADDIHRRHWEKAAVAAVIEQLGYYDDHSMGLGLGVAAEALLYLFSNHCGRVVGIDLYKPNYYSGAGITCEEVYAAAPFPYRSERLEILAMDMRSLDLPDASFDFVWSVSSVEHLDSVEDSVRAFQEIERVLRPGGHAVVTTEWNWLPANPVYRPGAIVLDSILFFYIISRLASLKPVGPIHLHQSERPEHVFLSRWVTGAGEEVRPCINLTLGGTYITPVLLILQKEPLDA